MPIYIANKAIERGYDVYALCMKGNAKESDYKMCTATQVVRLGQLGVALDFFKQNGITELVIAGRVQHTSIFSNLFPDKRGAKFLATLKSMQTSHILSRLIEEFRKERRERGGWDEMVDGAEDRYIILVNQLRDNGDSIYMRSRRGPLASCLLPPSMPVPAKLRKRLQELLKGVHEEKSEEL